MCARYEVEDAPALLAAELEAAIDGEIPPRKTIAPTDTAPVLVATDDGARVLVPMKFGWPGTRAKERVHLNTRSESVAREGDSRGALEEHRCLIPAHAFHEWSGPKGARHHHVFAPDAGPFTMAGLYVETEPGAPRRFVILTTAASREVRPFHHRMPLVVPPALRARWIARGEADVEALVRAVRHADPLRWVDREAGPRPTD